MSKVRKIKLGFVALIIAALYFYAIPYVSSVFGQDQIPTSQLLRDLGHDDFDVRENATEALIRRGDAIEKVVRNLSQNTKDPEVRARALAILAEISEGKRPNKPTIPNNPIPRTTEEPQLDLDGILKQFPLPDNMSKMFEDLLKGGELDFNKFIREFLKFNDRPEPQQKSIPRPDKVQFHSSGILGERPSDIIKAQFGIGEFGFVVKDIKEDSFAFENGIRKYDIIISVDNSPAVSPKSFDRLKGNKAKVALIRKRKVVSLDFPAWGEKKKENGGF